jgi:hypothetical protein
MARAHSKQICAALSSTQWKWFRRADLLCSCDLDGLTLMVAEMQRHLMQLFKEHAARSSEAQEMKELDAAWTACESA